MKPSPSTDTVATDRGTRFGAIDRLYGRDAIDCLRGLHVCVIGLGGVGSWAVEALARSGIGAVTLIDYDTVCLSNVNRQLHALSHTAGDKKHRVMAERIRAINPECRCTVIDDYLTRDNLAEYLSPALRHDAVIDAIDSIGFKAAAIAHCRRNRIPIVTTGGAGGLTDPTAIQVRDLARTWNDPLAAKVRSRLRDDYRFSRNPKRTFGVACVFSIEQPRYPRPDGTVGHEKPGIHGVSLDCRYGYGSAVFVTAAFGFAAAGRVVNRLLRKRGFPA